MTTTHIVTPCCDAALLPTLPVQISTNHNHRKTASRKLSDRCALCKVTVFRCSTADKKKGASAGGSGGAHFRARDRRDHFAITIHTRMHERTSLIPLLAFLVTQHANGMARQNLEQQSECQYGFLQNTDTHRAKREISSKTTN